MTIYMLYIFYIIYRCYLCAAVIARVSVSRLLCAVLIFLALSIWFLVVIVCFRYLWLRSTSFTTALLSLSPPSSRCASAAISGLHSRQQQQQQQEPLKTSCKQIEQQINKKEKLSAFLRVFNGEFYFQYSPPLPSTPTPWTCLAAAEYLTSFQFLAATWFSFTHVVVVVVAAVKQIFLLVEFSYIFFSFFFYIFHFFFSFLANKPLASFGSQQICCLPFGLYFFFRCVFVFVSPFFVPCSLPFTFLTAPQLLSLLRKSDPTTPRYVFVYIYKSIYICYNICPHCS